VSGADALSAGVLGAGERRAKHARNSSGERCIGVGLVFHDMISGFQARRNWPAAGRCEAAAGPGLPGPCGALQRELFSRGIGAAHCYPRQQIAYVMSGRLGVTSGGGSFEIRSGDTFVVGEEIEHQAAGRSPALRPWFGGRMCSRSAAKTISDGRRNRAAGELDRSVSLIMRSENPA